MKNVGLRKMEYITFEEAIARLKRGHYVPGEIEEGWYCAPPISMSSNAIFSTTEEAIEFVKHKADNGSVVHQAVIMCHVLYKLGAWPQGA